MCELLYLHESPAPVLHADFYFKTRNNRKLLVTFGRKHEWQTNKAAYDRRE